MDTPAKASPLAGDYLRIVFLDLMDFPVSMAVSAALAAAYYRWGGGWRRAHGGDSKKSLHSDAANL
jgi:hypothetical protein